jgi:hypothetical protein
MVLAAHALAEAFSVLTRVPRPHRLSASVALQVLRSSFLERAAAVVALDADGYIELLQRAPTEQIAGGRIYDAVIAACAVQARVNVLLTFNDQHFRPLLPREIEIVVPSE